LSIPNANSQTASTTTMMTITQPPVGQCEIISRAFTGQAATKIKGTFGSDASVDFYILSPQDFASIQNKDCRLPTSASPLYSQTHSVGHANPYQTLLFPTTGTYYFVFIFRNSGIGQVASGVAHIELTYPASTTLVGPAASTTSTHSSSVLVTTTRSTTQVTTAAASPLPMTTLGVVGLILVVAVVASVMVFKRKGKSQGAQEAVMKQEVVQKETKPAAPSPKPVPRGQSISTGYGELDNVLSGGLPTGYAVLLVSPPCDERDLLFKKIIESSLAAQSSVYFLSRDLSRTQDFASRYPKGFYVFSPQADKIAAAGNVFKVAGVQNLSDVNITFAKTVETLPKAPNSIIIIDLLTDILLEHKALTTRKWLDDFVAKRKSEGFTILGTLNPLLSAKQDTQTIVDLFDGIIEIYEKELRERARRFLIVKKMYGRKYVETELMLDKDKLY
jgi:KaiC/GvpD/RAD55 family RecA-like ATPase